MLIVLLKSKLHGLFVSQTALTGLTVEQAGPRIKLLQPARMADEHHWPHIGRCGSLHQRSLRYHKNQAAENARRRRPVYYEQDEGDHPSDVQGGGQSSLLQGNHAASYESGSGTGRDIVSTLPQCTSSLRLTILQHRLRVFEEHIGERARVHGRVILQRMSTGSFCQ